MAGRHSNPNWDPAQYLAFGEERLRPALDLIARIPDFSPKSISDLGCGPGTVTKLLRLRWPDANITGIDSSAEMLARAHEELPGQDWVEGDIASWRPNECQDLIFSNAALHWVGAHERLLPRLIACLGSSGALAIQMPDTRHGKWREILRDLSKDRRWARWFEGFARPAKTLLAEDYHAILAPHCGSLDIWASEYLHLLKGKDAVAAWSEGAGARPYLEVLPEEERAAFRQSYRKALSESYPTSAKGVTAFCFRRLFIVALKSASQDTKDG